jgi:hypothetical protein
LSLTTKEQQANARHDGQHITRFYIAHVFDDRLRSCGGFESARVRAANGDGEREMHAAEEAGCVIDAASFATLVECSVYAVI